MSVEGAIVDGCGYRREGREGGKGGREGRVCAGWWVYGKLWV